ncbi:MAG: hypothetical protein KDJ63_00025 [Nitratireductor sp.]|nr:hypothetical protein [Nitratireductor sp.]
MRYLVEYIANIDELLAEDSERSLTYAALEARLAIERVCYERLKTAHSYISAKDLKRWQPGYVMTTLINEVDPKIASTFTLSYAPEDGSGEPKEFTKLGTQLGFDSKLLSQHWQALGSFLHSNVPIAGEKVEHYCDREKMRSRLEHVRDELERLSEGTLTGAFIFNTVSFECVCGQENKRAADVLKSDQVVNCLVPDCAESYRVQVDGENIGFLRETIAINCSNCGMSRPLARNTLENLPKRETIMFVCDECAEENFVAWHLVRTSPDRSEASS